MDGDLGVVASLELLPPHRLDIAPVGRAPARGLFAESVAVLARDPEETAVSRDLHREGAAESLGDEGFETLFQREPIASRNLNGFAVPGEFYSFHVWFPSWPVNQF